MNSKKCSFWWVNGGWGGDVLLSQELVVVAVLEMALFRFVDLSH